MVEFKNNNAIYGIYYFWRTVQKQEIDWIEERDGFLSAYELKYNPRRKIKFPKKITENYPVKQTAIINKTNYFLFLSEVYADFDKYKIL